VTFRGPIEGWSDGGEGGGVETWRPGDLEKDAFLKKHD
jgi:hypothetical protein